jgi:uncharacterized membrane protein YkvI
MKKRRKLAYWLGALGVAITVAVFIHLEATDYTPLSQTALVPTLMLCPAAILSAGFLDGEPHSSTAALSCHCGDKWSAVWRSWLRYWQIYLEI